MTLLTVWVATLTLIFASGGERPPQTRDITVVSAGARECEGNKALLAYFVLAAGAAIEATPCERVEIATE